MKRIIFAGAALVISWCCRAQTWTRINAIPKTDIFCLELHNNVLYAGSADHIYVSTDNGINWTASPHLGAIGDVETITKFHDKIFAGTYGGGVFSSSNGGVSWAPVNEGISFPYITRLAVWKDQLYAGTSGEGFYKFDETAHRWAVFNTGFSVNSDGIISDLVVHNSLLLASAGANGQFYTFDTTTASWTSKPYIPNGPLVGMMGNHLLSDSNSLLVSAYPSRVPVLKSNDGGNSWLSDANGIQLNGYGVFANGAQQHYLAVNTFNGTVNLVKLYQRNRTAPAGATWGLPENISFTLFFYAMTSSNGRLYAATDSGLYYKGPPLVTPVDSANGWGLFPNPAASQTNMVFNLPARQETTIRVFDAAGKLVAAPYAHYAIGPGVQVLPLHTGELAAGVYFINAFFAGKPHTLKLVVAH